VFNLQNCRKNYNEVWNRWGGGCTKPCLANLLFVSCRFFVTSYFIRSSNPICRIFQAAAGAGGAHFTDIFVTITSVRYTYVIPHIQHLFRISSLYYEYLTAYEEYAIRSRSGFSQCVVTRPRFGLARNRGPFSGAPVVGPIQPCIRWAPEAP
jgi:hypothetical protein